MLLFTNSGPPVLIHNFLPNNKKSKRNNATKHTAFSALAQQHHKATHLANTPLQDVFQQPTIDPTWHELAFAVTDPETGEALEYKELLNHSNDEFRQQWQQSQQTNLDASHKESKAVLNSPMPSTSYTFTRNQRTRRLLMDASFALSDPRRKNKTAPASQSGQSHRLSRGCQHTNC
jgi:GH15 family glucan-1,4-alpha-glucosidase